MESQNTVCQSANCKAPRQEYCFDHQKILCHNCRNTFHFQCNTQRISKPDEMIRSTEMLERFTQILNEEAKNYGLLEQVKGLEGTLSCIDNTISKLKSEAASALANDHFLKYDQLKLQARDLKSDILNSKFGNSGNGVNQIFELLFYSQLFKCSKPEEKKNLEGMQINKDTGTDKPKGTQIDTYSPVTDTLGNNENVAINSDSNEGSENEVKRDKQASKNSKEEMHQLSVELKVLKDAKKEDTFSKQEHLNDLEGMKKQIDHLENENLKLNDYLKKEAKEISLEPRVLIMEGKLPKYQALYIHYFKVFNKFDPDTFLYLNMNRSSNRDFLFALARECVQLPELKEISIDNIKREHLEDLNKFLCKSISGRLCVLKLTNYKNDEICYPQIKEGLVKILPRVSNEILFVGMNTNASESLQIISHSAQARSLEFNCCTFLKNNDPLIQQEVCHSVQNLLFLCFRNCKIKYPIRGKTDYFFGEIVTKFIKNSQMRCTIELLDIHDDYFLLDDY
ncbi:unnamed protein product [Moneuplotes crassus]|uniref:Uncharacterized protein n=1 Tax=Euplotes crassus TaxID=5936 RepID=A0AAD1UDH3_EUPCR|nr:unnamed protein product [Moneuplotes crassus]